MASPQLENGFTTIANELAEIYAELPLAGGDFRVLWVILRETYGYSGGKKSKDDIWREISWGTFLEKTSLPKSSLADSLNRLMKYNIIERREVKKGRWEYRPQKNWEKFIIGY